MVKIEHALIKPGECRKCKKAIEPLAYFCNECFEKEMKEIEEGCDNIAFSIEESHKNAGKSNLKFKKILDIGGKIEERF